MALMTLFGPLWNFNFQESTKIRFEKVKVTSLQIAG
jgi:hypothetical protein